MVVEVLWALEHFFLPHFSFFRRDVVLFSNLVIYLLVVL